MFVCVCINFNALMDKQNLTKFSISIHHINYLNALLHLLRKNIKSEGIKNKYNKVSHS